MRFGCQGGDGRVGLDMYVIYEGEKEECGRRDEMLPGGGG